MPLVSTTGTAQCHCVVERNRVLRAWSWHVERYTKTMNFWRQFFEECEFHPRKESEGVMFSLKVKRVPAPDEEEKERLETNFLVCPSTAVVT